MNTDRVEIYEARRLVRRSRKQYRWRFVSSNGKQLANGGESYANLPELLSALSTVTGVPRSDMLEVGVARNATSFPRANGRPLHLVMLGR